MARPCHPDWAPAAPPTPTNCSGGRLRPRPDNVFFTLAAPLTSATASPRDATNDPRAILPDSHVHSHAPSHARGRHRASRPAEPPQFPNSTRLGLALAIPPPMPRVDAPTTPATATLPIIRLMFIRRLLRNRIQMRTIDGDHALRAGPNFRHSVTVSMPSVFPRIPGFRAQRHASSRLAPKTRPPLAGRRQPQGLPSVSLCRDEVGRHAGAVRRMDDPVGDFAVLRTE